MHFSNHTWSTCNVSGLSEDVAMAPFYPTPNLICHQSWNELHKFNENVFSRDFNRTFFHQLRTCIKFTSPHNLICLEFFLLQIRDDAENEWSDDDDDDEAEYEMKFLTPKKGKRWMNRWEFNFPPHNHFLHAILDSIDGRQITDH